MAAGVNVGASALPPDSAITETPVSIAESRRARVSARSGVDGSTLTWAITRRGSCGARRMSVTSPTLMPLKLTLEPRERPPTEPEKTMRTAWAACRAEPPESHSTKPKPARITTMVKAPIRA